ncbi:hypothetical protein F183_A45600 [Bryobacterales bacterium F-183]|nr:hypothetical protein F183_A45600 [Bryobacterales bacterium F-183]
MRRPGDVHLLDLGLAGKVRPVVVVSRFDPDPPRTLVVYVPLTSQPRSGAYEVAIPTPPFLDARSVANVQAIGSVPATVLGRRLGRIPEATLNEIRGALRYIFEI